MADVTKTVVNKVEADTKNYQKGMKQVDKANKKAAKSTESFSSSIGILSSTMSDGISQFNLLPGAAGSALKSVRALIVGFKTLRGAIIATGIGALILAIGSLAAFFASSEEGQAKLNKTMRVFGVIIGNISDVIADYGEKLFNAISDPKQAVIDLGEAIEKRMLNRLKALSLFGPAIKKIFSRDWKEGINDAGNAVAQLTFGVEDFGEKATKAFSDAKDLISGVVEETKAEIKVAQDLADLELETNRMERAFWVEQAREDKNISELRRKARQEDEYSAEQRAAYQREAIERADELGRKEQEIAENRLRIRLIENTFSKSTKENLDEAARLEAEVENIQKRRLDTLRGMERVYNQLVNKAEAEAKAAEKAEQARLAAIRQAQHDELDEYGAMLDKKAKYYDKVAKKREQTIKREQDLEQEGFENAIELSTAFFSITSNLAKDGSSLQKAIAISQGVINSILAVMAVWRDPSIPTLGKIAVSAGVAATMATMLADLKNTPEETYGIGGRLPGRKGGKIQGRSHDQGGVKFRYGGRSAEAEGGEFIVNKKSTAMFLPLIESINDAGNKYAAGGILASRSSSLSSVDVAALVRSIESSVSGYQPVLVTEDLEEVQNRVAVTENRSTLS